MHKVLDQLAVAYLDTLTGKAANTVDAYSRAPGQFLAWLSERPSSSDTF